MGNFNMLPLEIMLEIFTRVPAESILECKLVSTAWRNLVQHTSFPQLHLNHLIDSGKSSCIFRSYNHGLEQIYYGEYDENCHETPFNALTRINLNPPFKGYYSVGSCNGLICFNAWDKVGYLKQYGSYICNPITREYIMLPGFEGRYWGNGFAYILSTNEYKVVRIYDFDRRRDSNVGFVQVYTLGSGTGWRNAGTIDTIKQRISQCAGAYANGALHWVNNKGAIILAFHLADEKFIEPPSSPPPPSPYLAQTGVPCNTLGVLGDYLSATYYYNTGNCDIWLLKKNRDNNDFSWRKEFSLGSHISRTLEFTKSGRLLCYGYGKVYSYNPKASSAEMDVSFGMCISEVIPHKNTFVSLKVLGEKDTKTLD